MSTKQEATIKVLTLHDKTAGREHWFTSEQYVKDHINSIKDPEGGNTTQAPTSVPSPFAQMDLVRTAFANIAKDEESNFGGTPIDFKLVSDCFDMGEVFFNYERFKNKISIVTWNKRDDLNNLLKAEKSNPKHYRLGRALKLFLEQDADAFNFNDTDKLFLLKWEGRIIGGTSPSTLFFTTANDLSWMKIEMPNGDRLFDNDYMHLHERDEDFQLFIYAFQKALGSIFGQKFKDIATYLRINKEILRGTKPTLHEKIDKLTGTSYHDNYNTLKAADSEFVNVLNQRLLVNKVAVQASDDGQPAVNEYLIHSEIYKGDSKPMVLIKNHDGKSRLSQPLISPFKVDFTRVPYFNSITDLKDRELPGITNIKHPHVLISDFLEPYLIRLVYPMNRDRYFDGYLQNNREQKDYLLPIKRSFFDYFTTDNVMKSVMPDGKRMFELNAMGDGINAILRVPIHGGVSYITYERLYMPSVNPMEIPRPDEEKNKGVIVENQFGMTIFPFVKSSAESAIPADYRIMLIDRDIQPLTSRNEYNLSFHANGNNVELACTDRRTRSQKKPNAGETTHIYVLEKNFDYIQVRNGIAQGIVLPIFIKDSEGTKEFSFAIDFGTTNTHIEYCTKDAPTPKPFDITGIGNDMQVGCLHDVTFIEKDASLNNSRATNIYAIPKQLLHEVINEKGFFRFPQRTILTENERLSYTGNTYALADFNVPFFYEKQAIPDSTTVSTNLKWSNYTVDDKAGRRVEAFLEHMLFMIRTKVLQNGGDLKRTRIIWFYPYSMNEGRINSLEEDWNKLTKKYIEPETPPLKLSESIAPFYYYKKSGLIKAGTKPAVCVDIGGGTSDLVIFENNNPIFLSSFRFAANTIFGDAFSDFGAAKSNGFVQKYKGKIEQLLTDNELVELMRVYEKIAATERSEDIITFFFSLENNTTVKSKLPFNFTDMLKRDEDMRIIFIIFYIGIIYHLAKIMKLKGKSKPRYITFSGTGSRSINLITSNSQTLERLTKIVIEKVYGDVYDSDGLNIVRETDRPKEVTCKGGLMVNYETDLKGFDFDAIKATLLGTETPVFINEPSAFFKTFPPSVSKEESDKITYDDIDSAVLNSVKKEIETFIDFVFEVHKAFNFNEKLGVKLKSIDWYKTELKRDIIENITAGLDLRRNEASSDQDTIPVSESLFFYPLTAAINHLAFEIYKSNS